ncbi:hypothetical protein J132_09175, partial [Termitomyces sp. J132]
FHFSEMVPWIENDLELFPERSLPGPGPVVSDDDPENIEWLDEHIVDAHCCGQGWQYLVHYAGWGPEEDHWLSSTELVDNKVLDDWLAVNGEST